MQPYSITHADGTLELTEKIQPRTPGQLIPVSNRPKRSDSRPKSKQRSNRPRRVGKWFTKGKLR